MSKTAIIIPARYSSTRLNAKPLIEVEGKPIIQWVWERAKQVKSADMVIIATDSQEIFDKAQSFGADVEMTSDKHKSGSDRIKEVAERHKEIDYIINLQGDEPMINPECVEEVIKQIKETKNADIATLLSKSSKDDDLADPNVVKCVIDVNGFAMYFSRSKMPFERKEHQGDFYKHIGIYAYKRESLFKMGTLAQPEIEKTESLEQLRALYYGMKIKTAIVEYDSIGIDTIDDLNAFKEAVSKK
ncbi:MAG: 3-deoxy-manno-octulosonate cytidylyltransferase [Candidatus Gastranaerophilales bacterium]|nr:3-deoxy-manno-octulosonate cytidylyltransferase [Candidatus Gastranaerophilales bacterium]